MALQGKTNFKGIELVSYVKVQIGSISEKIDDKGVKTFILNYNYFFKVDKLNEVFDTNSDSCEYDLVNNQFMCAYKDLAIKLNFLTTEI